jgi:hypothetical protein
MTVATGRGGGEELLARVSRPNASDCRNVVAVSTNYDGAVKNVVHSILEQRQGKVNVGFLSFMTFVFRSTRFALCLLFTESRHVAFDACVFEGSDILTVAAKLVWQPSCIR